MTIALRHCLGEAGNLAVALGQRVVEASDLTIALRHGLCEACNLAVALGQRVVEAADLTIALEAHVPKPLDFFGATSK